MKKRSAASIFFGSLLKTLGIMALFLGVGILSYHITMLYYNKTARVERSTTYTHAITVNTGNESSNLIYSYNKDTKKIEALVLELFDETTKNLSYITIPVNTQITISQSTYADLIEVSQKLPQVATLSEINTYFTGDVAYEYGIMILQEEFKIDIGYFTAMSSDVFNENFTKKSKEEPVYLPSEKLLAKAEDCKDAKDMEKLMDNMWDDLISDTTLSQKQNYADALTQVNREYIRAHGVFGVKSGDVFILNKSQNRKMVNSIWESDAYGSPQKRVKGSLNTGASKIASSAGCTIQISNSTSINGLAAAYHQKLQADGYQVIGTGNYVGGELTETCIYVKKKKWGKDLLQYFKNATIEVKQDLTSGADIEIVLGTQDKLS